MAAKRRRRINEILELMVAENNNSDSDSDISSDDDDLEMLLLATFSHEKDLGAHLNFQDISEDSFESLFRFKKNDFARLATALQLPETYKCKQRTVCSGLEGLTILLRRLTYPNRWCDLMHLFGRQDSELSLIFNEVLCDIHNRFGHLLDELDFTWLDPESYSRAVYEKGAPLRNCWAFIDGTARSICRPVRNQQIMFSGHKRTHCLKFQSVIAPNGMICHLFGPMEGRRHDAFMLSVSGLLEKLEQRMTKPNGEVFVLYGDPAYPVRRHILAPFRGAHLSQEEQCFNADMSEVRTCVEWGYGKIVRYFAFLDFSKNLKVLLQPVAKLYKVAALLANCHTCLYGSQTGQFFNISPPVLETYLNNH